MSRDKKWSSNDKNQLLVENFRKFMEEGDFSTNPGKGPRLLAESSLAALDDAASYGSAIATSIKQSLFANRDPETFIKRIERIMYDEPGEGTHGSKRSTDDRLGIQGGTERMLNAFKKATGKRGKLVPLRDHLRQVYDLVTDEWDPVAASGDHDTGDEMSVAGGIEEAVQNMDLVLKELDKIIGGTPTGERGLGGDRFVGLEK